MSEVTKELSAALTYKNKTVYESVSGEEIAKAFAFADPYKKYLDDAKTEREAVTAAIKIAEAEGLVNGYRVVSNCGADAGQTVQHLHFHILGGRPLTLEMA